MTTRNRLPRPPAPPRSKTPPTSRNTIEITIAYGGTTYTFNADANIQRYQRNDAPDFVPTSGQQSAKSRPDHGIVTLKNIKNDFGGHIAIDDDFEGGVINVVHDVSGFDTRGGTIYLGPAENNPGNPTDAGTSTWMPPAGNAAGSDTNRNPRGVIYFDGSTNAGLFGHRTDDAGTDTCDLVRWTGTAWTEEATFGTENLLYGHNQCIHKGALCTLLSLVTTGVTRLHRSTDGDTTAATVENVSSAVAASGSKIIDAGNILYLFLQNTTTTGAFDVKSTDDNGATAYDSLSTNHPGILRDVEYFHDWVTSAEQIFVLTEAALFIYNTTSSIVSQRLQLPAMGHALLPFHVNGQRALLIFMDAGRVNAILEDGTRLDISPGGSQGMPSGKDFGPAASGQTCVTATGQYAYALFSGLTTAAAAIAPLCLAFDGTVEIVGGKVVSVGWHYIWQKADTSIAGASRFIAFDPVSGDLLMGVQDAISEDTTLIQLKDIEVPPELQATWDRRTAGTITTRRLDFAGDQTSTTVWGIYAHTNGLGTNKSLAHAYRVDGSTGAYTTVATVTTDNTRVKLPDNSAGAAGVNFADIQFQFTGAANAATDKIRFYNLDIGYRRVWPVRDVFVVDIYVDDNDDGIVVPDPNTQWTNINTIRAATTLATLNFSKVEGDKYVFPKPEASMRQNIPQLEVLPATRRGMVRMLFSEP